MAAIYSNGGNRWNILGFNFTKRDALSSLYKISMVHCDQVACARIYLYFRDRFFWTFDLSVSEKWISKMSVPKNGIFKSRVFFANKAENGTYASIEGSP